MNRALAKRADLRPTGIDIFRFEDGKARFFDAAYEEYNRGEGFGMLLSAFSDNLVMDFSDGTTVFRGHEFMAEDLERDLEVGLRMYPTNVVASKDVTIIECDIENPPDDPSHCPPAISQVAFYRDGRITRMRWHLAPRPRSEGCWEETILEPLAAEGV